MSEFLKIVDIRSLKKSEDSFFEEDIEIVYENISINQQERKRKCLMETEENKNKNKKAKLSKNFLSPSSSSSTTTPSISSLRRYQICPKCQRNYRYSDLKTEEKRKEEKDTAIMRKCIDLIKCANQSIAFLEKTIGKLNRTSGEIIKLNIRYEGEATTNSYIQPPSQYDHGYDSHRSTSPPQYPSLSSLQGNLTSYKNE